MLAWIFYKCYSTGRGSALCWFNYRVDHNSSSLRKRNFGDFFLIISLLTFCTGSWDLVCYLKEVWIKICSAPLSSLNRGDGVEVRFYCNMHSCCFSGQRMHLILPLQIMVNINEGAVWTQIFVFFLNKLLIKW